MAKYRIGWLPGDGVGQDVMAATRKVLDALKLDAEYIPGDIGWEFWRQEGNPLPDRTIKLLKEVDEHRSVSLATFRKAKVKLALSGKRESTKLRLRSTARSPTSATSARSTSTT